MFVLMSSRSSSKLGYLVSKTRSPGQINRKLCYNHFELWSECLPWSVLDQALKVLCCSGERYRAIMALLFHIELCLFYNLKTVEGIFRKISTTLKHQMICKQQEVFIFFILDWSHAYNFIVTEDIYTSRKLCLNVKPYFLKIRLLSAIALFGILRVNKIYIASYMGSIHSIFIIFAPKDSCGYSWVCLSESSHMNMHKIFFGTEKNSCFVTTDTPQPLYNTIVGVYSINRVS